VDRAAPFAFVSGEYTGTFCWNVLLICLFSCSPFTFRLSTLAAISNILYIARITRAFLIEEATIVKRVLKAKAAASK